jgi:hypothetical protein
MSDSGFFSLFGFSSRSKIFGRLGILIDNSFYIILTTIGTIALGFGGGLVGNYKYDELMKAAVTTADQAWVLISYPLIWMLFGAVLVLLGAVGTYKDQKKLQEKADSFEAQVAVIPELNDAINSAQETMESYKSNLRKMHSELVATHLKSAYKSLDLTTSDRISIYYEHANDFYLLARYSKNPVFAKPHRQKFALNQGVIGKAWQNQKHVEKDCPNSEDQSAYLEYLGEKYGFKPAQALNFAMKSCRYVAVAIADADSHTGVIVFESIASPFFDGSDGQLEENIYEFCRDYQSIHSKFLRDGLELNREVNAANSTNASVEKDFLNHFKEVTK